LAAEAVDVEGATELVLGDLHPGRIVGALETLQRDWSGRWAEAKTVSFQLELRAQQGVASLQGDQGLSHCLFSGAVAERQHHNDVERRVRVRQRLGGLEGSQRAALYGRDVDDRGYHSARPTRE
jgi:hypothetical protein